MESIDLFLNSNMHSSYFYYIQTNISRALSVMAVNKAEIIINLMNMWRSLVAWCCFECLVHSQC